MRVVVVIVHVGAVMRVCDCVVGNVTVVVA